MVSEFNIDELQKVLQDFYLITKIRITVFDDQFQELVSYPEQRPAFCRIIRSCVEGNQGCIKCDRDACQIASKQMKAYIYRCHSGLTEAIMPLYVGRVLVGYLLFGHIFSYDSFEEGWNIISQKCAAYPINMEQLKEACRSRPQVSKNYIASAARILHATASHLVLERMASLQQDSDASQLDKYLSSNFHRPLSAESICRETKLGRTKLYKLSKQLYGVGPSEHIRALRIERAKSLLTAKPSLSIGEIANLCGYDDYNYFISVFTKDAGISPGKYRKQCTR